MRPLFALVIGIGALVASDHLSAQFRDIQPVQPAAVRAANSKFAGIWKLVKRETRDAKDQPAPIGSDERNSGYIIYDPAGYVGVVTQDPERVKFAGAQPTVAEARAALNAYSAYWGSFAVNEATSVVTHQTFGALSPTVSGTDMVRNFTFSGNRLILRPPTASGNQTTLTWERVPDLPNLTPTHRKLIGFWKLVLLETRSAKGDLLSSSPGQTGFIIYTASGHVMVHMMMPYRRRNAGPTPTPEETMATYRTYTGYFGRVTVNEAEQFVLHHIEGTFNSGAVGTDFKRFLEFSGRRLILHVPVTPGGDGRQSTITWERLSD